MSLSNVVVTCGFTWKFIETDYGSVALGKQLELSKERESSIRPQLV